jgi:hypothetical protein
VDSQCQRKRLSIMKHVSWGNNSIAGHGAFHDIDGWFAQSVLANVNGAAQVVQTLQLQIVHQLIRTRPISHHENLWHIYSDFQNWFDVLHFLIVC